MPLGLIDNYVCYVCFQCRVTIVKFVEKLQLIPDTKPYTFTFTFTFTFCVRFAFRDQLLTAQRKPASGFEKWKHQQAKAWKRTRRQIREVFGSWEVWQGSFKVIDGKFEIFKGMYERWFVLHEDLKC